MRRLGEEPSRQPLVSILTPSLNQGPWLADNLHSVACQTYPRIEHIVMDGGSTDGSIELLAATGQGVTWSSEPDEGQAHAINKAFARASGEIIGWINSDDAYFTPDVIEDVVAYFSARPEVDVLCGHCVQTTADGRIIQVLWTPPSPARLLRTVNVISQPATFMRREVLGDTLLDETFHFAMDYELWLRLYFAKARFARLDRVLAIDRQQPMRKSSTVLDVHARDMQAIAKRYDTWLGPKWEATRTRYYLWRRVAGVAQLPRIRPPFAFGAPEDIKRGLLARQLLTRQSRWPEEMRG